MSDEPCHKKSPLQHLANVLSNEKLSESFWQLDLSAPSLGPVKAGQFLQILCRDFSATTPFLRRPFSVMNQDGNRISLFYKRIGPGTQAMSRWTPGQQVDILGPLGQGFEDIPSHSKDRVLVIAGGTGLGGIYFYLRQLALRKIPARLLLGLRCRADLPTQAIESLTALGCPCDLIFQDEQGLVTTAFDKLDLDSFTRAAVCGPTPMMTAVHAAIQGTIPKIELSLEEMMGCGYGICFTCPVQRSDSPEYLSACEDGPVFDSKKIKLASANK